jgi:hypothetical protein
MKKQVCKKCGSENGFFIKTPVTGHTTTVYDSNGIIDEEQGRHFDTVLYKGNSKNAFCVDCFAYVGKTKDLVQD